MALLFWLLTFVCLAIACLLGGREGRIASAMIFGSVGATIPIQMGIVFWQQISLMLLLNDTLLFAGFFWLAARSGRSWLVWMAGMQVNAVLINVAAMLVPVFAGPTYFSLEAVWALPILVSMASGVLLDHGQRNRSTPI